MILVLKTIGITIAILAGLGLTFGFILAIASKLLAVKEDPRKKLLLEIMLRAKKPTENFLGGFLAIKNPEPVRQVRELFH